MSAYKVYKPSADNTIIKQEHTTLYFDYGVEALYKNVDIQLISYEWIHLGSWTNETNQTNDFEYTLQQTVSITGGDTINTQWNFKEVLKGLSVVMDGSTSTVTEDVFSKTENGKGTIRVLPQSSVHLYQKRYSLKAVVWFQLDASSKLWTVGKRESADVLTLEGSMDIDASDFITTPKALSGSGSVSVSPASGIRSLTTIRQFQNCTPKSQDYLHTRGV